MQTEFKDNSREVLAEEEKAIKAALEKCGMKAETYAKENLTQNRSVDTGRLRNSITHVVDGKEVTIGSAVEYAPYVELGHHQEPGRYVPAIGTRLVASFVAGKPYLRPAAENHSKEYSEIIEQALRGQQ